LAEESLTQNGAAQVEQEAPTAAAAPVNKSTPAASQAAPSLSNAAPKSVPAPVSSPSSSSGSNPVIKSDKSLAPSSSTSAAGPISKAANSEASLPAFKKPELSTKSALNTSSATLLIPTVTRPAVNGDLDADYGDGENRFPDTDQQDQDIKGKTTGEHFWHFWVEFF
jgi:hypothetical protein